MQSGPDNPGTGRDQPKATSPSDSLGPVDRLMQQILAKLHEGHGKDAARIFIEAHHRSVIPKGPQLLDWLVRTIGREEATRLIGAFAHFPCVYCKGGVEQCDACAGRGVRAEGPFCDTCAGLGMARCEFCDGEGLAAYSFFPQELWLPIIAERSHMAIHQLGLMINQPIPRFSEAAAEQNHANLILNLNKLIGVLENAAESAQQVAHSDSRQQVLGRIHDSCTRAAAMGAQYLRQVIRSLAAVIRQSAKTLAAGSAEAQFRESRAIFYDNLSHSAGFEGTCLHHPFLEAKKG